MIKIEVGTFYSGKSNELIRRGDYPAAMRRVLTAYYSYPEDAYGKTISFFECVLARAVSYEAHPHQPSSGYTLVGIFADEDAIEIMLKFDKKCRTIKYEE